MSEITNNLSFKDDKLHLEDEVVMKKISGIPTNESDVIGTIVIDANLKINGTIDTPTYTQEVVDDAEWLQVTTDSSGRVLGGRYTDGNVVEYCDVEYPNGIPSDIKSYVNNKIEPLEEEIENIYNTIEIVLPDNITAVVGDELQIFYRSLLKTNNPYNKNILLTCNEGKQYPRYFDYIPLNENVGTTTFNIKLRNDNLSLISQKTCNLITVGEGSSPTSNKNILCIGDSLTTGGIWVSELSRRLTLSGGTPAGKNFNNITFCGSMGSDNKNYFAVGGWQWNSYATQGTAAYRFYVTGVNSISHFAQYTNNGVTFRIIEINITNGNGNILGQVYHSSGSPEVSGTLTLKSGSGDKTITFTRSELAPANPFWDAENQKITFIPYVNNYCGGIIDAMYVVLGGNGLSPNKTDFSETIKNIKDFASTLHSEFPNIKLKITGCACISFNGGAGANSGATGSSYADLLGIFYAMLNYDKTLLELANSTELTETAIDSNPVAYNTFVEYVDLISQIDCENNMQKAQFNVNTRNSTKEYRDINEVHPATGGYYQVADIIYRNIIKEFCQ